MEAVMKNPPRKEKLRTGNLTGQDQLCAILLKTLYSTRSDADARHFLAYRDRARQILNSPHAFDMGHDTLSVTNVVVNGEGLRSGDATYKRLVNSIIELDQEPVTARADELRMVLYAAIDEAQLLGAALMFEMLGGVR
jgi:hypothetical protein